MDWKKTSRKWIALAAAAILAAALFSGCAEKTEEENSVLPGPEQTELTVFPDGTSIGGKNISGKTVEEALTVARNAVEDAVSSLEISVKFKEDTVALTREDLTVAEVYDLSLPRLLKEGKAEKAELSYVTDLSEAGKEKLAAAAERCVTKAKNSTVSKFDEKTKTFVFTPGEKGSRVDMVKTLQSIRQLLSQKRGGAVQASFFETDPAVSQEMLTKNFKLMGSYSTDSSNTENGNSNMRLALSKVNGTILEPGQEFSYNDTIGDSTDPDYGWLPAGGLSGGVLVQMYGGGICQASTTIYNAAMRAGLEVVERDCHSSPSTYCPIGLDATVDYGNIDFRLKNPLKTPVYFAAWMEDVTLYVNIYGCFPEEWDRIEVDSETTGTVEPLNSISFVNDESLQKGQFVRKSSGNYGYYAKAWRIYYKGDKQVKTEALPDSYYEPTGMVYAIGEGTEKDKVNTTLESGTTATPSPSPSPSPSPDPTEDPGPGPVIPDPGPSPTPPEEEEPFPEPPPPESSVPEIPDDSGEDGPEYDDGIIEFV